MTVRAVDKPMAILRRNTLFPREPMTGKRNSRSLHFGRDDKSVAGLECLPVHFLRVSQNCHPDRSGGTCCSSSRVMGSRVNEGNIQARFILPRVGKAGGQLYGRL